MMRIRLGETSVVDRMQDGFHHDLKIFGKVVEVLHEMLNVGIDRWLKLHLSGLNREGSGNGAFIDAKGLSDGGDAFVIRYRLAIEPPRHR